MVYQKNNNNFLGQSIEELNFEHAKKQGVHDAIADVTRITIVGAVVIAAYILIPKKYIRKISSEAKNIL